MAPPPPTAPIAVPPTIFYVHCACIPLTRVHARPLPIAYTLLPQVFDNYDGLLLDAFAAAAHNDGETTSAQSACTGGSGVRCT